MQGRRLAALCAAAGSGFVVLALAELAALVLYRRLLNGSPLALAVLLAIFSVVGGYAAWLVAVVVFSGVRGADGASALASE